MLPRKATTLLLVTHRRIAHARMEPAAAACQVHSAPCPEEDDLPTLVEAAARLGGRLQGGVWLLIEDLFTQTLSLSPGAVRGLERTALEKALALESQVFSGLPPTESALAWEPLSSTEGTRREYWVAQVSRGDLDRLGSLVKDSGGRLLGVLHPGGLTAALSTSSGGDGSGWKRVELWRDVVTTVQAGPSGGAVSRVDRSDPHRWRSESGRDGTTEILIGIDGFDSIGKEYPEALDLGEEPALARWLTGWAKLLGAGGNGIPVVRPPPHPLPLSSAVAISAVILALTIGMCGLHHSWIRRAIDQTQTELEIARAPAQRSVRIRGEIEALEKQAAEIRDSIVKARAAAENLSMSRRLPSRLLKAIAAKCPPGVVVDGLDLTGDAAKVQGQCISPDLADRFAGELSHELQGDGFQVFAPLKRTAKGASSDDRYDFEIDLVSLSAGKPETPGRKEKK